MLDRKQFEIEMEKQANKIVDLIVDRNNLNSAILLAEEGLLDFIEIRGGYRESSGMTESEINESTYRDWLGVMWHKAVKKKRGTYNNKGA